MTEQIITVTFAVESQAYQAINALKRDYMNNDYTLSHVALVKRVGGVVQPYDTFDSGVETADDAAAGGLVGSLVGILGGPLGVILGGSMGALVGHSVDVGDAAATVTLLEKVAQEIAEGETALLILAQENTDGALDRKFAEYQVEIVRHDAAEVAAEVEYAAHVQQELEAEARKKLREEKKEERKQKANQRHQEMKDKFEAFKAKYSF